MSKLRISRNGLNKDFHKVTAIKAVRILSGLGLKQAKDAVEAAMEGEVVDLGSITPREDPAANHEALDIVRNQGLEMVHGDTKADFILKAVAESARLATSEGETELAILLLNVLKEHKENVARKEAALRVEQELHRQCEHNEMRRTEEREKMRRDSDSRFREQNDFR